jgi:copper homeostasis protein
MEVVEKVRRASTVDLRVMLRFGHEYTTSGGEMARLKGMASSCLSAGVDGFVFGFLNAMSGVDVGACVELAGEDVWGWTFDQAVDAVLNQDQAWEDLRSLPRLDSVMSAGSAIDIEHGMDRLVARNQIGVPIIAAGGLVEEQIPWLVRGGLRRFYVDRTGIRAEGVRAWRNLIDEEMHRISVS